MLSHNLIRSVLVVFASCSGVVLAQQDEFQVAVTRAVDNVAKSVVQIETLGGLDRIGDTQANSAPTTGLVVSSEGYIVSSSLNFAQRPASILVRTETGKTYSAEIVGRDESRKLVLLKIEPEEILNVPESVSRKALQVGQTAIALGKTYHPVDCNISVGIVSATHRIWGRALQTDAKISAANFGGPLIDLKGRVIGILVPMSPRGDAEESGAQWYDSGIGFAVSLDEWMNRFEQVRTGEPLLAGKIGVQLRGTDIYSDAAVVSICSVGSPAAAAGMRSGDEIVEMNGQAIERIAQLKHAVGPLYAGDSVQVVVRRNDELVELEFELVDQVPAYQQMQLGVLPAGGSEELIVRYVINDTPAFAVGLRAGDQLQAVNGRPIESWIELRKMMQSISAQSISIQWVRGGAVMSGELMPSKMTAELSIQNLQSSLNEELELVRIQVPEFSNRCIALVPKGGNAKSVLVWLPPPGLIDEDEIQENWAEVCKDRNMVIIVPQSKDPQRWDPSEIEFIDKAVGVLRRDVRVDKERIAIGGRAAGGAMSCLTAIERRDIFRGLIVLDSLLPSKLKRAEVIVSEPLLVYVGLSKSFNNTSRLNQGIQEVEKALFPIHLDRGRQWGAGWRRELGMWVDTLNRL